MYLQVWWRFLGWEHLPSILNSDNDFMVFNHRHLPPPTNVQNYRWYVSFVCHPSPHLLISESEEEFAKRVQTAIASKLSVDALPFDGKLKSAKEQLKYREKLQACLAAKQWGVESELEANWWQLIYLYCMNITIPMNILMFWSELHLLFSCIIEMSDSRKTAYQAVLVISGEQFQVVFKKILYSSSNFRSFVCHRDLFDFPSFLHLFSSSNNGNFNGYQVL